MKLRSLLFLFVLFFAFETNRVVGTFGNSVPAITDLLEVHNIAFNLAEGRGYRFDWDDPRWRQMLQQAGSSESLDFILARHGSHPTLFRPPFAPLVVAGLIRLFPDHSFAAWRTFDCFAFSIGACLLCDLAYSCGWVVALVTMLALLLFEPLLKIYVPGCWTEGIAFDLLSAMLWLLVNSKRPPVAVYRILYGIAAGLLCLDRAVFVLMIIPLCLLPMLQTVGPFSQRMKNAGIILAICLLAQMPWWARNIAVSHRFLPLGTQGGFNLPDEYGDTALSQGNWTGRGMANVWTPPRIKESDIAVPAGYSEESFQKLWFGDRRTGALFDAVFCRSLDDEIQVSDRGTQAACAWIVGHPAQIPGIMLLKAKALAYFPVPLFAAAILTLLGLFVLRQARPMLVYALLMAGFYALSVILTHVVLARFLVPMLPMVYLGCAIGVAAIGRLIANAIRATARG